MGHAIGIDLGTTFSAAAVIRPGGRPELLWNREGDHLTPSVVLFQDAGQVLVGKTAKNAAKDLPDDCVQFVKRQMGNPGWSFADSHGGVHGAEELSGLILRRLAEDAAEALGEVVRDVVITVPAYFDDARRTATRQAGEIAGLNVLRLINEPTAAGIAFGSGDMPSGTLLVYDLGGGTFDVTVMRVGGDELEVIATTGDRNLGGFDFDNRLMEHVAGEVLARGGPDLNDDGRLQGELREKCEQAKHALTRTAQTRLFFSDPQGTYTVTVTRDEFERLTEDLLARTADAVDEVLDEARLSWTGIDRLLLVGGSTKMPMVREMIERVSGKAPDTSVNPDEAIALGAAIVAEHELARRDRPEAEIPYTIQDVTSQGLGVIAVEDDLVTDYNQIIIAKNTRIPCQEFQVFETVAHHQRRLDLQVTEGDDDDPDYVTKLVERPITLPGGLPKGAPIKVVMSYDIDGVVHVELIDLTNDRSLGEVELERPRNLDAGQVTGLSTALKTVDVL
ncbi:Hsp70 family protein [Actinomadura sp. 9N215]|uniref:Hsp70 family protein n=1 Tax=Actinomadura sp. 9N215 TaxID=3375150 RepID=UPI0037B45AE0